MPISFDFACPMDWDAMTGDDTRRHCGACNKHVTNLSNLTPTAARRFLERTAGSNVCVQVSHDPAGNVRFARAAVGVATMAALTVSNPAVADGTIPNLLAPIDGVEATGELDPQLDEAELEVLEDIVDEDCGEEVVEPIEDFPKLRGKIAYVPPPAPNPPPSPAPAAAQDGSQ